MLDQGETTQEAFKLRPLLELKPALIVVGASTGGPKAILDFLQETKGITQPILITQHIPNNFTKSLAKQLQMQTGRRILEASHQVMIQPDTVYLAPGDFHMIVCPRSVPYQILLTKGDPENFCRPAVDPLFKSAATRFRHLCLGIILTGIGKDGFLGAKEIIQNGGQVFAQDKVSSIVWGMPGAICQGGLASTCDTPKNLGILTAHLCTKGGE